MIIPVIIADTHLYHEKCIVFCNRPKNVDEIITNNLLELSENNILIHLGDYSWKPGISYKHILKKLKCKKILVRGNHDKHSNSWYLKHGWDFICRQFKDEYFGKKILFSHKPQKWDGWYDLNIHGHFHNLTSDRWEEEFIKIYTNRHLLISPELTGYKPISLNSIISQIQKSEGES